MHTYLLRNSQDRSVEVRSEGEIIIRLNPNESVYFASYYGDLEPFFYREGVDCSVIDFIEVDPDFLAKCKVVERDDFEWKEEGF